MICKPFPAIAAQPRRAADAAGAAPTWARFTRKARPPLCQRARSFHIEPAAARALAGRGFVPPRVALYTAASGAANA